jgi:predicted MFS family arabinose efflux permease
MIQHQSNKTQWRLIFVLWFCGMGASMQFAKVSLAFDELQAYYQASEGEIGVVLSWVGVCGMILAAGVSVFIARFGYRRLLFLAMILAAGLAVYQISLPSLSELRGDRWSAELA